MADLAEEIRRQRFANLIQVAFGNQHRVAAHFFGVVDGSIANWVSQKNFPRDYQRHLEKLGLRPDALESSDEEWARLLHAARVLAARKSEDVLPNFLYTGGQVQIVEEGSAPGDQVMWISDDGANDTHQRPGPATPRPPKRANSQPVGS